MPKKKRRRSEPQKFRFRRGDRIGENSAESDPLLKAAYLPKPEHEAVFDLSSAKCVLIGRTGTGKTALLDHLERRKGAQVIAVKPLDLSITHLTSNDAVPRAHALGVNMDPLYRWLWRHVILVEVIRRWNETRPEPARRSLKDEFIALFRSERERARRSEQAERDELVDYVEEWGEKFFAIEQLDVREVVDRLARTMEDQRETGTRAAAEVEGVGGGLNRNRVRRTQDEQEDSTREVFRQSAQEFVSSAQTVPLRKATQLVERHILSNAQRPYFVVIDDLDHAWVDAAYAYDLIIALLMEVQELSRSTGLKVIVSLREDVIAKIERSRRQKPGLQWEKLKPFYVRLRWTEQELYELIDRRLAEMATGRRGKRPTLESVFPSKRLYGHHVLARQYIYRRTMGRPREMIDFVNECIEAASPNGVVSWDSVRDAEIAYSGERLTSLDNEWGDVYPGVSSLLEPFREWKDGETVAHAKRAMSERLGLLPLEADTVAYRVADMMTAGAEAEGAAARLLLQVLYEVGAVGLKGRTDEIRFSYTVRGRSKPDVTAETRVYVHPGLYAALRVRDPHYVGK